MVRHPRRFLTLQAPGWDWVRRRYRLMLDYGSPAFIKHHTVASFETEGQLRLSPVARTILRATHTLSAYVKIGWETGIRNEFNVLRQFGVPKVQSMEAVLFFQLYAGMRGLGHTSHAVGDFLSSFREPTVRAEFPPGWDTEPGRLQVRTRFLHPRDE